MSFLPGTNSVGGYQSASLASGSAVSLSTGTAKTPTGCSIALSPGEYDVEGVVDFQFGATTSYTALWAGIGTSADTLGAADTASVMVTAANVPTAATDMSLTTPTVRFGITTATTVYLVAKATFTVSTLKAYGTIRVRKVR